MSVFIGLSLTGVYPSKWLLPPIMFTVNSSHLTRQSIKCVKWVFMYGWIVAKEWWITQLTGKIQVSFDRICNIKGFEVHVSKNWNYNYTRHSFYSITKPLTSVLSLILFYSDTLECYLEDLNSGDNYGLIYSDSLY